MAAGHGGPVVPKFGSWDADNIGYTVFFDKVRENKTAPTPAPAPKPFRDDHYDFDPYEHYDNLSSRSRPASSHGNRSRPASSHGSHAPHHRPQPQQHHPGGHGYHRRNGSNGSSAASEVSSRASKFSPPKPYQPRYSGNDNNSYYPAQHGGGGGGAYGAPAPRQHHHHAAPRVVAAASPPRQAPPQLPARATKASAVPRFGVWDEQNAAAGAQGFTVQFEKVKKHREVARAAAPDAPPEPSPERVAPPHAWRPRRKPNKSFMSKMYRCLFPRVRE